MAQGYTPTTFAAALLGRLGIPVTRGSVQSVVGWEKAEGGNWNNQAAFNPLNTTQAEPGSQTFRSVGQGAADIRIYRNWNQGLNATVATLKNSRYGGILNALKAGNPQAAANAIDASPWGTHGALIHNAILGTHVGNVSGLSSLAAPSSNGGRHQGLITSGSGSDNGAGAQSPAPSLTDPGQAPDLTGLLQSLLQRNQPQVQSSPIAPPSFAAGPKLAQGAQPMEASAPQAQQSNLSDLLSAISGAQGTSPQVSPGQVTGNAENAQNDSGKSSGSTRDTTATGAAAHMSGPHGSKVLELIHNDGAGRPGFGIKNGQTVNGSQVFSSVWAGHANHVHVAAGPKTVVALGKLAQSMGLHVGENPHFGGVSPVHVPGSYHYKGEAIDVSGPSGLMDAFARAVVKYNRNKVLPS